MISTNYVSKVGDLWLLGKHRLLCGDATKSEDVQKLMGMEKADLVFTDPPYGMKKKDFLNDNLNCKVLLEFNKKWIPLTFSNIKINGSWYCWGKDEPLMDIYSHILKPMQDNNKITFRNLITWDKQFVRGENSGILRNYAQVDEKCLFVMMGIEGTKKNSADSYFEEWEPVRNYLLKSRLDMNWDVPTMKRIVGHSDISKDHWTSRSQFYLPTQKVYEAFQKEAEKQRKELNLSNDAFKRNYEDLRREYELKRAYFDNSHDRMNSVWHFPRASQKERLTVGGHPTPKPLALCSRAIKSSSREQGIVLDVFGGSGSTLIACEQQNRRCLMMEILPKWCDVIVRRWQKHTGDQAIHAGTGKTFEEMGEQ